LEWNGDAVCAIASTPFTASSNVPGYQNLSVQAIYLLDKRYAPWRPLARTFRRKVQDTPSDSFPSPLIGLFRVQSTREQGLNYPNGKITTCAGFLLVVPLTFLMGLAWNEPNPLEFLNLTHPGFGRAIWFFRCPHLAARIAGA
jgi:hypothetical protein